MRIKDKIRNWIKHNGEIYTIYQTFTRCKDKEFQDWINKYKASNIIEICDGGVENPNKIVYHIKIEDAYLGFFGLWKQTLHKLGYAETLGFIPVVDWGNNNSYYEEEMGSNPFEYYFQPVSEVKLKSINNSKHMVISKGWHQEVGFEDKGYVLEKSKLERYVILQKKYINLRSDIENRLLNEIEKKLQCRKTIGVQIRGVEWGKIANHPIPLGLERYVEIIDKEIKLRQYEQIFLATDSEDTIIEMKKIYGDRIVYFDDVARAKEGSHTLAIFDKQNDNIPLKHYMMGYEVLRDMMALSNCEGFVAGYSNISLAALVWKQAQGYGDYECCHIMNNEINKKGISVDKAVKIMKEDGGR